MHSHQPHPTFSYMLVSSSRALSASFSNHLSRFCFCRSSPAQQQPVSSLLEGMGMGRTSLPELPPLCSTPSSVAGSNVRDERQEAVTSTIVSPPPLSFPPPSLLESLSALEPCAPSARSAQPTFTSAPPPPSSSLLRVKNIRRHLFLFSTPAHPPWT